MTEIETQWSFQDIMRANEVLDIKEDVEKVTMDEIKDKTKNINIKR